MHVRTHTHPPPPPPLHTHTTHTSPVHLQWFMGADIDDTMKRAWLSAVKPTKKQQIYILNEPNPTLASSPGPTQILSCSCGEKLGFGSRVTLHLYCMLPNSSQVVRTDWLTRRAISQTRYKQGTRCIHLLEWVWPVLIFYKIRLLWVKSWQTQPYEAINQNLGIHFLLPGSKHSKRLTLTKGKHFSLVLCLACAQLPARNSLVNKVKFLELIPKDQWNQEINNYYVTLSLK